MCRAAPAVGQCENKLNAATNDIGPATAMAEHTFRSPASVPAVKMLVFAPALATEPKEMLLAWARGVSGLGTGVEAVIVLNGPGSERAAHELRKDTPPGVQVHALPGLASIGRAQQFIMHQFLRSDSQILVRIDPDGQFPLCVLPELCRRLLPSGPDVVVIQRDEVGVSGRIRFLGNVILRLDAMRLGLVADPNSGCYVMNRRAAAALGQAPLPKYPEPRMLAWLGEMSLQVSSVVVPTLPRQSGTSTIKGLWRAAAVFISSLMEFLPCQRA